MLRTDDVSTSTRVPEKLEQKQPSKLTLPVNELVYNPSIRHPTQQMLDLIGGSSGDGGCGGLCHSCI